MKYRFLFMVLLWGMYSCQKSTFSEQFRITTDSYQNNVARALYDSMPHEVYHLLDMTKMKKGNPIKNKYGVRIPFRDVPISKKFVQLVTDSNGRVLSGRVVEIAQLYAKPNIPHNQQSVTGSFSKTSLDGKNTSYYNIVDGRAVKTKSTASNLARGGGSGGGEDDADEPDPIMDDGTSLPDFILVCTPASVGYSMDFYFILPDFSDYTNDSYYLGYYQELDVDTNIPGDVITEVEFPINNDIVALEKLLKCFQNVSSYGATYSVKLCTDIPANSNSGWLINGNLSPGHAFLTLTKTNGDNSVTQSFGFYPGEDGRPSDIHNDANHEYNASLTMNISEAQFQTVIQTAENKAQSESYDLNTQNCANFALDVFNSVRSNPIQVDPIIVTVGIPGNPPSSVDISIDKSPQKLFDKLLDMKNGGGSEAGAISIDRTHDSKSPTGNGTCN
ncbi:hypothetical protein [Filimonas effusa]|uniref:Uncharacterized protein n=1 Tax=Filimonas effusa TaxID=2508721 RepID=A0A4Q1D3G6_9BACT|nr:hypothetical protein [Filimonas effusa]RXK81677.1 hypothetical protein ESB13_17935 [Filimonas effusa]